MYPDENLEPEDLGAGEDDEFALFGEKQSRFDFDRSSNFSFGQAEAEEALRTYWLYESFFQTDYNGDGITELRKVCTVGDYVLQNDEIDSIPFVLLPL